MTSHTTMTEDKPFVSPYLRRPIRSYAEYLRDLAERERRHRNPPANDNDPTRPDASGKKDPADGRERDS